MARFCTQCGAPVEDGVLFCTQCGARLSTEPEPAASEAPTVTTSVGGEANASPWSSGPSYSAPDSAGPAYSAPDSAGPAYTAPSGAGPIYGDPGGPGYGGPAYGGGQAYSAPVYRSAPPAAPAGKAGSGGGWIVFLQCFLWLLFAAMVVAGGYYAFQAFDYDEIGIGIAILAGTLLVAFGSVAGGMVALGAAQNIRRCAFNSAYIVDLLNRRENSDRR